MWMVVHYQIARRWDRSTSTAVQLNNSSTSIEPSEDKKKVELTITIASSEENGTRNKFAIIVEVHIIRAWENRGSSTVFKLITQDEYY